VPVAHACNPSYSGGKDQEDHSSKPAQANSSKNPILKKNQHKKGLAEWLSSKNACLASIETLSATKQEKGKKKYIYIFPFLGRLTLQNVFKISLEN
jgi:hypothetical protein